jgi:(S)-mandelate dehydrogenase
VVMDGLRHPSWLTSVWLKGGMPRMENLAEFTAPGTTGNGLAEFMRANRNPYFSWDDVQRLRDQWHGPLVLKGVLSAEDALEAERIGLQGVVISNHGGRQLDGAPASIDVLPEIANAVSDETVVLIDSGFRRGSDIVKAVACGADGVLLGRATLFGLSAGGQEGVAKTISILRDEISRVMALIGCPSVAKLSKDYLRPASAANKGEDNADIHDG